MLLVFFTILLYCTFANWFTQAQLVRLNHGGHVKGYERTFVKHFLGIPYAKPPIGSLRFKPPRPVTPWKGIKDAKILPNACVQTPDTYFDKNFEGSKIWNPNTNISEDCLYINVWTPERLNSNRVVMVWIYGGGYYSGSSALSVYDGARLAKAQAVTVVSMNYRLNLYGFLYFPNEEAPGNMGLLDQKLALEWVRDNIKNFGGDPNKVTIFGESAGAAAVELHTLSPISKGLFKNAIMQSGTAIANWATITSEEALKRSLKFSKQVKCWDGRGEPNYGNILKCLRGKPSAVLTKHEFIISDFMSFSFVPVIDGYFLPEDPEKTLEAGGGNPVNVIYGLNKNEGNYFIIYYLQDIFKKHLFFETSRFLNTSADFKKAAITLMPKKFKGSNETVIKILREYGGVKYDLTAKQRQEYLDKMVGDYHFSCPVLKAAFYRAKRFKNVYVYYMTHRTEKLPWPKWMGVLHGYEIQYVFGEPWRNWQMYKGSERSLSTSIQNYYFFLAQNGNPNGNPRRDIWPKFTTKSQEYLIWDTDGVTSIFKTARKLRSEQCHFWNDIQAAKTRS